MGTVSARRDSSAAVISRAVRKRAVRLLAMARETMAAQPAGSPGTATRGSGTGAEQWAYRTFTTSGESKGGRPTSTA